MPNAPSPPGPFQWKTWFHGLIQPDTASPQSVCGNSSQLSTKIHSPPPNRIPVWSGGQRNSFRKLHFPGALAVRQGHAVEFGPMSRDLLGISGKAFLSDLMCPSPFPSSCFECRHNAWKCSSHFVAMRWKKNHTLIMVEKEVKLSSQWHPQAVVRALHYFYVPICLIEFLLGAAKHNPNCYVLPVRLAPSAPRAHRQVTLH